MENSRVTRKITIPLLGLTLVTLRQIASATELPGYSRMKKVELAEALWNYLGTTEVNNRLVIRSNFYDITL